MKTRHSLEINANIKTVACFGSCQLEEFCESVFEV